MYKNISRTTFLYLLLLALTTCIYLWAYSPGINGGFYFDDNANIEKNPYLQISSLNLPEIWQATWSGHAGHLKRPIPVLSFAMEIYFFGLKPNVMKISNILLHFINSALLLLFAYKLLSFSKQRNKNWLIAIAAITSCAWLLHPFNLTGVLYIVQRMTSMSAFFTIICLLFYISGRNRQQHSDTNGWYQLLVACPLFGLLAIFSKENAILIPYFILCIEVFLFKFSSANKKTSLTIKYLIILITTLPILAAITFFIIYPEWLTEWYEDRDFTLRERLLTQARVLVWYMQMIVTPNINSMGIFLDDIVISKSIFNPISTAFSVFIIFILFLSAFILRNKAPIVSFGIAWFFAGHLLESTVIPLEIAFEHRNYLPSFGLLLALAYTVSIAISKMKKLKRLGYLLAMLWLFSLTYSTHARAIHWENPITLALFDSENHPTSSRANVAAAFAYIQGSMSAKNEEDKLMMAEEADRFFSKAIALDKTGLSSSIGKLVANELLKNETDKALIQNLKRDLSNIKLDVSTQSSLLTIKACQKSKICNFHVDDVTDLLQAAIDNPYLSNQIRASLMVALADHYIFSKNDLEKGEQLIRDAIAHDGKELHYRTDIVNLLIGTGRFSMAQEELNTLRKLDKFKFLAHTTNFWQNHLDEQIGLHKK